MKTIGELRPAVVEIITREMKEAMVNVGLTNYSTEIDNLYCLVSFSSDMIGVTINPDFHDTATWVEYFDPKASQSESFLGGDLYLHNVIRSAKLPDWRKDLKLVNTKSDPWKPEALGNWIVGVRPVILKYIPAAQQMMKPPPITGLEGQST